MRGLPIMLVAFGIVSYANAASPFLSMGEFRKTEFFKTHLTNSIYAKYKLQGMIGMEPDYDEYHYSTKDIGITVAMEGHRGDEGQGIQSISLTFAFEHMPDKEDPKREELVKQFLSIKPIPASEINKVYNEWVDLNKSMEEYVKAITISDKYTIYIYSGWWQIVIHPTPKP